MIENTVRRVDHEIAEEKTSERVLVASERPNFTPDPLQTPDCMREMPRIFRGLIKIAKPFRGHMLVIFGLNILISCWELGIAAGTAVTINVMGPEALNGPFRSILFGLALYFVVLQFPAEIALLYLREWYATKFFKPYLEKELVLMAVPKSAPEDEVLQVNTAPASREGRQVAISLLDMLARDTASALRGLGVLVFVCVLSWYLAILLFIGMLVDLMITRMMNARCTPLYETQKDQSLKMLGIEFDAHEPVKSSPRLNSKEQWNSRVNKNRLAAACNANIEAIKAADLASIHWQNLRAIVSKLFTFTVTVIVAYWVYREQYDLPQFFLLTSVFIRAREPLTVFLQFQSSIMSNRELLRRLGLLIPDIDFGIDTLKSQPA